ncbi:MAG TPA: flagellar basal body rod C-terminal domain-containing protein [Acidocella sp.]|nr:flagellar basal body rod C-terminal domain-containing protein [Acidocella sp.]
MSGINNALTTALSGLDLFETGIETVSNNLTNATTPGYAVESVSAQEATSGANEPGSGVLAPSVTRATSAFAAAQLRSANAQNGAAGLLSTQLTSLSNALTGNGDVQGAMSTFFNDLGTLAAEPTSDAQAATVLSDAGGVAAAFQSAAGTIQSSMAAATSALGDNVTSANGLLGQLASINHSLTAAPNDASLLDQQQAALNSLSSLLGVTVTPQADGGVIVSSGGTMLLTQAGVKSLSVGTDGEGNPEVMVGNDGTVLAAGEGDGAIGAALYSYQAGAQAQQGLNALATNFASAVNTAQAQGLTSSGAQGGALFTVPAASATASQSNTGTGSVSVSALNAASLPANGGPFTLTSTSSGWSAVNQATGQPVSVSSPPPSFAGITLAVTGTPAVGDSWTINPAPGAASSISVAASQPEDIAAADPYVANLGTLQANGSISDNNAGTIIPGTDTVVSSPAGNAAQVPAGDYGQDLIVTFTSPTAYTVAPASNPAATISGTFSSSAGGTIAVAYPSGSAAAGTYWQLPITGTPAAGDTLTLTPGGADSGSNATRMAALFTATGTTSSGTLEQSVVDLGASLGVSAQAAQTSATDSAALVTTATSNLQTASGVNSDQQAVLLSNYEQAYQASAQVISVARDMFSSLISAVGA